MWYVYMLECKDGSLYTGITNNLDRRFKEHQKRTTHYTSYNPPKSIVYTEQIPTRSEALKREAQLKGWSRAKKLALAEGRFNELRRLSKSHRNRRSRAI